MFIVETVKFMIENEMEIVDALSRNHSGKVCRGHIIQNSKFQIPNSKKRKDDEIMRMYLDFFALADLALDCLMPLPIAY